MAEKDRDQQPDDGPSLELPSFGRKRKRKQQAASEPEARPQPPAEPEKQPEPQPEVEQSAASTQATAEQPTRPPGDQLVDKPVATEELAAPAEGRKRPRFPALPELPDLGPVPAALITGALVGVITVGLTWLSLRLCEVVRGTSSCGNPGFLLLLAIAVGMVLLGKLLLSILEVPEPGSTSFLGVGLTAMLVLVFLVDALFSPWMVLAVPAVAMASYALAQWVTGTFVGPESGSSATR